MVVCFHCLPLPSSFWCRALLPPLPARDPLPRAVRANLAVRMASAAAKPGNASARNVTAAAARKEKSAPRKKEVLAAPIVAQSADRSGRAAPAYSQRNARGGFWPAPRFIYSSETVSLSTCSRHASAWQRTPFHIPCSSWRMRPCACRRDTSRKLRRTLYSTFRSTQAWDQQGGSALRKG